MAPIEAGDRAAPTPTPSMPAPGTNFGYGPHRGTHDILNIQPVIPIHVNEDWNIITAPSCRSSGTQTCHSSRPCRSARPRRRSRPFSRRARHAHAPPPRISATTESHPRFAGQAGGICLGSKARETHGRGRHHNFVASPPVKNGRRPPGLKNCCGMRFLEDGRGASGTGRMPNAYRRSAEA